MNRTVRCVVPVALLLLPMLAVIAQPSYDAVAPSVDPNVLAANVVYPKDAIREGINGRVVVRALIDSTGRVERASVCESDDRLLDQAALDAVMNTQFRPGYQFGKPIRLWVSLPINFVIDGIDADNTDPAPDANPEHVTEPSFDEAELREVLVYPETARSQGIEGTVIVRVLIDELGMARRYRVKKSAGGTLNKAAIDAIYSIRFAPGVRDGEPVRSWVTVPVTFSL